MSNRLRNKGFINKKYKSKALVLSGDWGYFVGSKKLSSLKSQIEGYKNDIFIYFQDVRASIILMLFIKDCLIKNNIKNVYLYECEKVGDFLVFLASKEYNLFINNEIFDTEKKVPKGLMAKERKRIVFFESIGQWAYEFYESALISVNFLGLLAYYLFEGILHPSKIKFNAIAHQIYEHGFKALPIALLAALIVGYAITLQGAIQLNKLGAPLMSIDATAKLSLREMGPFILALLIAGRSASSFSAQIGAMRLSEELSAMQSMNLNFFHYLVIPRVLALVIVMPLVVFATDAMSLFGGMLALKGYLGIGFTQYIDRFYETVPLSNFWVGIIKAPFFAAIIAIVGCMRGLTCYGDTQSIGKSTTVSLVNAMFWIILANAIFSFIFTRLNI